MIGTEPDVGAGRPTVDRRVDELLERMTLKEKAAQLGSVNAEKVLDDGGLDRAAAEEYLADGIGHRTRIGEEGGLLPLSGGETVSVAIVGPKADDAQELIGDREQGGGVERTYFTETRVEESE